MNVQKLLLCLLLFVTPWLFSQKGDTSKNELGISAQFYPAGFIPTLNLEHHLSDSSSLLFRVGANITDRQDFSDENETEEGRGFGGSLGFRKRYSWGKGDVVAGFNTDIWSLDIDWTDFDQTNTLISGSTYILVLQPWLEAGYFLPIKNSKSQIGLTLGFGREINIITSGEDVAQGFIGSLSLQYYFGL